jgi:hypothetical protein
MLQKRLPEPTKQMNPGMERIARITSKISDVVLDFEAY